ncbi:MAG: sigma-70 family RNA polymerase sigma factor [Oscillospiraceae bacterium]|nr:sigma-70 family RNA polymerase sigma factor [Oscillospiraceae bacterium]
MQDISQLFYKYRDDVYRLAVSYTRSREDAEDVCQTVFLKLMEQKHIDPGKEKHWLLRVTANECRNLLRSHWWKTTVPMEDTLCVEPPKVNEILQSVLALEPKYRVVVYLHYYEMLSTEEIASLLHITRSAVTTRLSRARQMLKTELEEV